MQLYVPTTIDLWYDVYIYMHVHRKKQNTSRTVYGKKIYMTANYFITRPSRSVNDVTD